MDNRLVLTAVLAALAWMSVGTNAQTAVSNVTTAASNATTATPSVTTAASNATTAASNATTAAPNVTTAAPIATTAMNNTTTAMTNVTTAMSNLTTATVTTAAPLVANTTVVLLQTAISRTQCGTTKLCGSQPADCDPSGSGSCYFFSTEQISGQNIIFQVAGESAGYLAAILSTDSTSGGNNDTTYVCANNNGSVQFFGALLTNNTLTVTSLPVNSVKGSVNGTKIQCTFSATVPDSTRRAASNFAVSVSTGTFNATSGALGSPSAQLRTNVLNLSNPSSNVTNQITSNTTVAPTTGHGITIRQSLPQVALLIVVGLLGLTVL